MSAIQERVNVAAAQNHECITSMAERQRGLEKRALEVRSERYELLARLAKEADVDGAAHNGDMLDVAGCVVAKVNGVWAWFGDGTVAEFNAAWRAAL